MEGGEFRGATRKAPYPVHTKEKWWGNGIPCRLDIFFLPLCINLDATTQDLGNTNFSIHLPRHSFDRHVTAQIALRAVRSFGIDARVNDRNDICVGEEKMSSSCPLRGGLY